MRLLRRALMALGVLSCLFAGAARAQTATELLTRGIRATHDLEYDTAAALLRSALDRRAPDALSDTARPRALMYLGATEFFREHRDSASAAFRRLLLIAPRYRPDQLIFPPEVSSLFEQVRIGTAAVAVVAPALTELENVGDRFAARLYAASLHMITVSLVRPNGRVVRTLYSGAIGDSLEVLWDGRDSAGVLADSGALALRIDSRGQTSRVVRSLELALDVRRLRRDTVPLPPPPADALLLPESAAPVGGYRPLLVGLAGTVAAIALPAIAGTDAPASGTRLLVGAASAAAGIVGFFNARRPQPLPANIAANQAHRAEWQQHADAARAENVMRRATPRLVIRTGVTRATDTP